MKYKGDELVEFKKRIDFNLTEQEVLVRLIKDACGKGEKMQEDMRVLRKIISNVVNILEDREYILKGALLDKVKLFEKRAIGIDGSFQLVGGIGGKWYVPISVARVVFENGFEGKPYIDIFWAGIEEIDETEEINLTNEASLKMLTVESRAIFNWSTQNKSSFVFIDGPIADPPSISPENYVKERCEGIKKCLEKSIVIGCVKRSRDKFYIQHLKEKLSGNVLNIEDNLNKFLTDQYFILFVFSYIRSKGYHGPLFTKWIDISSVNKNYELYKKYGIYIICLFFQKDKASPVIRLDIPLLNSPQNNPHINDIVLQAVKATDLWTYPGQDYPLPVILAHEKCKIREGCAQVLYEEIITKSRSTDHFDQLILMQLR
ncbi:MAG: DNA double-strand break repair nuclease NurA [Candidatus Methanomethylicia archaeon]|nr:DNA double-strand break repair nuclease NurA [Candidatus Methanomethylicia archaeon]